MEDEVHNSLVLSEESSSESDSSVEAQPSTSKAAQSNHSNKRKKTMYKSRKASEKKRRLMEKTVQNLADQVSHIQNFIASSVAFQPAYQSTPYSNEPVLQTDNISEINADVSRELYDNEVDVAQTSNSFDIALNTVLKEPSLPKTLSNHIDILNNIQYFNTDDWNNVRFAEVQKQYCSVPGFIPLETNDELKPYDKYVHLASIERGFAAITHALIMQNEALQQGFKLLVEWSNSVQNNITSVSLQEKLNEIFIKGSLQKISSDVLQLTCGHRANLIQQRRENILRSVKDTFLKTALNKIPPTQDSLFQKETFTAAIEKAGGITKVFWPSQRSSYKKAAAQAQPLRQQTQALPSYTRDCYGPQRFNYPENSNMNDYSNRFPAQAYINDNFQMQARDPSRFVQRHQQPQVRSSHLRSNQQFQSHQPFPKGARTKFNSQARAHGKRRL